MGRHRERSKELIFIWGDMRGLIGRQALKGFMILIHDLGFQRLGERMWFG